MINNRNIIKQKNVYRKILDLAVILGDSSIKKFIGFQMKYYEKGTNFKNPKKFLRINLKDKIKTIIEKVLEDFNLKVNE